MLYSRSLNIKIKRRRENIIFKIIDFNIIKEFWRKFMCGIVGFTGNEYYGAPEPPVRCGESYLPGLTEPPQFVY